MKKKIVFLFLIVFFLGTTNLVANNFSDCLMRERLKARAKGFSLDSAIRHSLKFCNSKFIKRKKPKQKLGRPYFGLDLITGSKRVCGTNCGKIEEKKLHSTNGVIVDIFITSGWSFSGGILKSMSKKYPYQNGIVSTQAILKTEERTYGIKFHLKASDKSGLDLYLGGGIALLIARKTADDLGEVEKKKCMVLSSVFRIA